MKSFLKSLFTVILGSILASVIMFFFFIGIIGAVAKSDSKSVESNSVLMLDFEKAIPDLTDNAESNGFSFGDDKTIGVQDYVRIIENAKSNDKIKGIYLECSGLTAGTASAATIRKALVDFKTSGKFIIAYANNYTQKAYYLASAADKVYLQPQGGVDFKGLGVEIDFIKGTLDKLGIKANVFYCGKYKSATENIRRTDMSPENKEQLHALLDGIYASMLTDISAGRNLSVEELKKIANDYAGRDASRALATKLVDGLRYKDEVLDELRSKLGVDAKDDIKTITANDYFAAAKFDKKKGKNKIAVVYCEGSIGDGDSDDNGTIAGERYARMLRKIRQDDKVKAVVLRVNSPGGSAQASDCIWREVERLKQAGIPVVTSMGDVAASGGYYIACNSDRIFAEPNCITGSIGVFGIIPNMRQLYNNTLAITADTIRTAKFAAFNPLYFDMTPEESQLIQGGVDSIYHTFKSRVSKGRNLDMAKVEEIAQGRVWLAPKAKEIGLVDELGSLKNAIDYIADKAGISSDYKTVTYPEIENGIEKQLKKLGMNSQAAVQAQMQPLMQEEMGMFYKYYDMLRAIGKMKGIQMRLPYNLDVK